MGFWKSRTFWTLLVMFALNVLAGLNVIQLGEIEIFANVILTILAFVFRWQASGPLSVKS